MTVGEIGEQLKKCKNSNEVCGMLDKYDKDALFTICKFLHVNYEERNSKDFIRNQIAMKLGIPDSNEQNFPQVQHTYGGRGNGDGVQN